DTCIREVAEETGIAIGSAAGPLDRLLHRQPAHVYEPYPVWRHRCAAGVTHNTEHVFGLEVGAGTAVRLAPHEHVRHEWLEWRGGGGPRRLPPSHPVDAS